VRSWRGGSRIDEPQPFAAAARGAILEGDPLMRIQPVPVPPVPKPPPDPAPAPQPLPAPPEPDPDPDR
jgi:hypothetical protein